MREFRRELGTRRKTLSGILFHGSGDDPFDRLWYFGTQFTNAARRVVHDPAQNRQRGVPLEGTAAR